MAKVDEDEDECVAAPGSVNAVAAPAGAQHGKTGLREQLVDDDVTTSEAANPSEAAPNPDTMPDRAKLRSVLRIWFTESSPCGPKSWQVRAVLRGTHQYKIQLRLPAYRRVCTTVLKQSRLLACSN